METPTFELLHAGKARRCKCIDDPSISENLIDSFARRVGNDPPVILDFQSFEEEKRPLNAKRPNCRIKCKYAGVSITRIYPENEQIVLERWADVARYKPRAKNVVCKFRFRLGAGRIWPTPSTNDQDHFTLLKSDEFSINHLEVESVLSLI